MQDTGRQSRPSLLIVTAADSESGSPGSYGAEQTVLGPSRDLTLPDGTQVPFRVPKGEFDFGEAALRKMPSLGSIDVLMVCPGNQTIMPRNISAFKGPKILLVGDTHYRATLEGQLRYAASEPFDLIFVTKRQHAHWLRELLGPKVYWLPYIVDEPPQFRPIAASRRPEILLIGHMSPTLYTRRVRLCQELQRRGYPLKVVNCPPDMAPDLYNQSLIVLNVTCNGDANARFVTVPAAGGFLLTDRVSDEAGVSIYYTEGSHYDAYGDPEELFAKIDHYLLHPEEAAATAQRAQARYLEVLQPDMMLERFWQIVYRRDQDDLFTLLSDPRFGQRPHRSLSEIFGFVSLYEHLQERQRQHESTDVLVLPGAPARFVVDAIDLPRVRIRVLDTDIAAKTELYRFGLQGHSMPVDEAQRRHWNIVIGQNSQADQMEKFNSDGKVRIS